MNSGDKIINRIESDCDEVCKKIDAQAQQKCDEIINKAQQDAGKAKAEIEKKTMAKLSQMNAAADSRSALEIRNTLLKKRREEIDRTVDGVLSYLMNLGDEEYFETLYKLASKLNASGGEVMLNQRDLDRLPADFERRLSGVGMNVRVSSQAANIAGGMILKNGNIEENLDFTALVASNRDKLEDYINKALFAQ